MITAAHERPVYFEAHGATLAGVLTVPEEPNGVLVLIPWGGGAYPSSGKNRIRTRLARAVAEEGYHAFRFDYEGVGESSGVYQLADMRTGFRRDIKAALAFLGAEGFDRIIVVANCIGGFSSITAVEDMVGLEAMMIVRAPVARDHRQVNGANRSVGEWVKASRKFRPSFLKDARRRATYRRMITAKAKSLVSRRGPKAEAGGSPFGKGARYLLERRIPLFLLYSADDDFHRDLTRLLDRGLGAEIEQADATTRLVLTDERLQGWGSLAAQDLLVTETLGWLREVAARREAPASAGAGSGGS